MEFLVQTTDNEQTLMSGAKSESVKEGLLWTMQTISLDIEQNKWVLNRRYLENILNQFLMPERERNFFRKYLEFIGTGPDSEMIEMAEYSFAAKDYIFFRNIIWDLRELVDRDEFGEEYQNAIPYFNKAITWAENTLQIQPEVKTPYCDKKGVFTFFIPKYYADVLTPYLLCFLLRLCNKLALQNQVSELNLQKFTDIGRRMRTLSDNIADIIEANGIGTKI